MKVIAIKGDKRVEVEIPDEQFEKLFAEKKKTGYERVENNEFYWFMDSGLEKVGVYDQRSSDDCERYEFANYFSDKTVAENMARAQKPWNRIHRRAVELCEPMQTTQMIQYYVIIYDVTLNKVVVGGWTTFRGFGTVWFDTEEHCQQVIDEFRDELLWYFTQFRDRADM